MDEESVGTFTAFTGASEDVARRYLSMTEGNAEQAIQLFFDSPDLGSAPPPPVPQSTRPTPQQRATPLGGDGAREPIEVDSDDDIDMGDDIESARQAEAVGRAADYEDDEAVARRIQEELYAGGDASGGTDAAEVRAPMAPTTETLVGDGGYGHTDMHEAILEQMRVRQQARATDRAGVFNQRAVPSIWDEATDPETRRQGLAAATGGASEASSKNARLAELFRPPFDMMYRGSWDDARDEGKEQSKWLLVNLQNSSVFDCQSLNRDIWKHDGIKELVKENFIFLQYSKDDPRSRDYTRHYIEFPENDDIYPHIAIVDPRTGEGMKVWSGPPVPKAPDFLMQLVEYLDRYSLDPKKKNPVARRKPEKAKAVDVDRLTEEEMLELALQNSLAGSNASELKEQDPDILTQTSGDAKGKGKGIEGATTETDEPSRSASNAAPSPFSQIASDKPHTEPAPNKETVTRIQFRHPNGRIIRQFTISDPVRRIYEWLKAAPMEGKEGVEFELKSSGKDLIDHIDETIEAAGLKNSTVMVEFLEE
ncbi:UBX domain-containing protein [Phlyctema vagabunda]|uniref:UBX domain-containing protein n=1 Tax=Phlyctema vagabunda TaxID=108571 RepID=A0ABR4PPA8_9HELO